MGLNEINVNLTEIKFLMLQLFGFVPVFEKLVIFVWLAG
jgi:hypothetical protein